jgi:predicted aspartyl protease
VKEGVFKFNLDDADSLILITGEIQGQPLTLALDTGASHSVIDFTCLLMAGYSKSDFNQTVQIETAKGIIEGCTLPIQNFTVLGVSVPNWSICTYDFIENEVLSGIDGVLGLDFFRQRVLTLDFQKLEIRLISQD